MSNLYFTIPNAITMARIVAIPFVVQAILGGHWTTAFTLFVLAGASDGVDGFIARHFNQMSPLGTYLDPLADKGLTIAVFSAFVVLGILPAWLLVLVVARDVAILAGAGLLAVRGKAHTIRPLMISKVNTALLLVLAAWLLAAEAFGWSIPPLKNALIAGVVVLTAVSAIAYGRMLSTHVGPAQGDRAQ